MKQIIFLIVTLLFSSYFSYSQADTSLLDKQNTPAINCKTASAKAQKEIVKYSVKEANSILFTLREWETHCGDNEPIQRLKILLSISQVQEFDGLANSYFEEHFDNYLKRVHQSEFDNYKENYSYYAESYNYVPLRGKFDEWTKQIALYLIENQALTQTEYLYCLLFSNQLDAFDNTLNSKEFKAHFMRKKFEDEFYKEWANEQYWTVSVGVWQPVDKMQEVFKPNPSFTVALGGLVTNTLRLDAFINYTPPTNASDFEIRIKNDFYTVTTRGLIVTGILITKEKKITNHLVFDLVGGMAYGGINTDLMKPERGLDDEESYYTMSTIDLSLGANLRVRAFERKAIGLNFSYHYSPYKIDKRLITNVGNQYFTSSLFLRF